MSPLKRAALFATLGASVAAIIASFFPWYGASVSGSFGHFSATVDAWHGYSSVALLVVLVVIALAATSIGLGRSEPGVAVGLTVAAAILSVVALAIEVGRITTLNTAAPSFGGFTIGFRWGAWVLVAAMSVAVITSVVAAIAPPRTPPPRPAPPWPGAPVDPQYGYAPPYGYAPTRSTNAMAILALVLAFVFAPAAIVVGHVARSQIRRTGEAGEGLAMAGLIIGYLLTALAVALVVAGLIAGSTGSD
jgi:hypothetical protein